MEIILLSKESNYISKNYYKSKLQKLCHEMGPIISFNLKRPDGSWYGYREVEKLASLSGIQLRV